MIVGSGGIKTAQTYQKDITLKNIIPELQELDKLISRRQRTGEIEIDHDTGEMSGNLTFTSGDIS